MSDFLQEILSKIETNNPLHFKKLLENQMRFDPPYVKRAENFLSDYQSLLNEDGKDTDHAVDCYLNMLSDFVYEQINFTRTGKYSNTSFDAVNELLYNNPEKSQYYMHGLLLSQFLWFHHYGIFSFFAENINQFNKSFGTYLEIGGGHGLYLKDAKQQLENFTRFDLLDISPTSIELAKRFINSEGINYLVKNVFDYNPELKYDFVSMCEVLEHVEEPLNLLQKLKSLMKHDGTAYITTPTNAPTIDHIYLFNNTDEIRTLIKEAGFRIEKEVEIPAENMSIDDAHKNKVCVMYGAFLSINE